MFVTKRDKTKSSFDINKIENVLKLAFKNSNVEYTESELNNMLNNINMNINDNLNENKEIDIENIQNIVEKNLMKIDNRLTKLYFLKFYLKKYLRNLFFKNKNIYSTNLKKKIEDLKEFNRSNRLYSNKNKKKILLVCLDNFEFYFFYIFIKTRGQIIFPR